MIHIDSVTVAPGGRTILRDFSLEIAKGEKVALHGESGTGKSTLLKTLIGLHIPVAGRITMAGLDFIPNNLAAIRKQMFYLPQDILPLGDETVLEYLKMPFQLAVNRSMSFPMAEMDDMFTRMRLNRQLPEQPFFKLSGGERKRVGIISGLLLNRAIILADEPTAGVDAANRDVIAEILFSKNDTTVLAVTHDETLMSLADRRVALTLPTQAPPEDNNGRP